MSTRQALASALHLFVIFFFFVAGFFFISLPFLPETRGQIVDFFSHRFEQCTLIGFGLLVSSLILTLGFYAMNRGRYLVIRMGISTELSVVRQAIEECLSRNFSQKLFLSEVEIARKSLLEIKVSMTPSAEQAQQDLFIQAEKELKKLLRERFGYSKPFDLFVRLP